MNLVRMNKADGSWLALDDQWQKEFENYEDDYSSYAQASLGTLRDECDNGKVDPDTGVFALIDSDGRIHAASFLNNTFLKGFEGKVLRVRHLILW